MPIPFMCPHCGARTLVDDHWIGFSGPCADCGRTIVVPQQLPARTAASPLALVGAWRWTEQHTGGRRWGVLHWIGAAAISAMLLFILSAVFQWVGAPAYQAYANYQAQTQCLSHLRKIGLALRQYEGAFGCLPPAIVYDQQGQPQHSWRVLILPYLGKSERALYEQYDFSRPWNDPTNAEVGRMMPRVFASPGDPPAYDNQLTSYHVLIGEGTAFHPREKRSFKDITDPHEQTILVFEVSGGKTHWLEPDDPQAKSFDYTIRSGLGGCHPGGVNVLLADGSAKQAADSLTPSELEPLFTIQGGEGAELR